MDLVKGYDSEMDTDSDIEEVPLPPKHVEVIDIDNSDSEAEVENKLVSVSNTSESVSTITDLISASTKRGNTIKDSKPSVIQLDFALTKSGHTIKESTIPQEDSTLINTRYAPKEPEPPAAEQNVTPTEIVRITIPTLVEPIVTQLDSTSKTNHGTKEPESDIIELDSGLTKTGHTTKEAEPSVIDLASVSTISDTVTTEESETIFTKLGLANKQSEHIFTKSGLTSKQPEHIFNKQGITAKQPEFVFTKSGHTSKQLEPSHVETGQVTKQLESVFIKPGLTTKEPEIEFTKPVPTTKEPEPIFTKPKQPEPSLTKPENIAKQTELVFTLPRHTTEETEPVFTRPVHITKEPDPVLTKPNQTNKESQQVLSSKSASDRIENDELSGSGNPVISRDERNALTSNDNLVCRIPRHLTEIKNAHKDLVSSLDWCTVNNPSVFLSSSFDGFIKLWDVVNMNLKHSLKVHTQVTASKWSLDGAIIFTGGSNKKVAVYEAQTVQKFIEYDVYCKVYSMTIHPYIHDIVLVGLKNVMLGYDLRVDSLLPIRTFPCKCEEVLDIAFLDDNIFVSSSNISFNDPRQNRIIAWEFGSSKTLSSDIFSDHCVCPSLKLHPSDSTFIAQTTSNYIATFSSVYPFAAKNKKFAGHNVNSQLIECDISPDGKYVATGDANGAVHFYSYAGGNQVYTSSPQSAGINRIKWNPCITTTMITSSVNGNIQIWN